MIKMKQIVILIKKIGEKSQLTLKFTLNTVNFWKKKGNIKKIKMKNCVIF